MAVDWVREQFDERTSDKTRAYLARSYVRKFLIKMTDKRDGPRGARLALNASTFDIEVGKPYPSAGYQGGHTGDLYSVVEDIRVRPVPSADEHTFEAVVSYSTLPVRSVQEGPDAQTYPLARPYEYRWATMTVNEAIDKEVEAEGTGDPLPIATAAGEPFEEGIGAEDARLMLSVTRNERDASTSGSEYLFSVDKIEEYRRAVNHANWSAGGVVWPPKTARVVGITADKLYELGIWYWRANYQIAFDRNYAEGLITYPSISNNYYGWRAVVLHQGTLQKIQGKDKPVKCTDSDGNPVSVPVHLDVAGVQLPLTDPPTPSTWRVFNRYPKKDFDALQLNA